MAPGRAVINVFRDLRDDLAGKIGLDAGNQRGGDHGSGLHDIGRRLFLHAVSADGAVVVIGVNEGKFAILHVLRRTGIERRGFGRKSETGRGIYARTCCRRRRSGCDLRITGSPLSTAIGEEFRLPRRLDLGKPALLFGIDARRLDIRRHGRRH